jgi:hypothetical protein
MDLGGGKKKEAPEGAPVVTAPFIAYAGRLLQNTALEACRQADVAHPTTMPSSARERKRQRSRRQASESQRPIPSLGTPNVSHNRSGTASRSCQRTVIGLSPFHSWKSTSPQ